MTERYQRTLLGKGIEVVHLSDPKVRGTVLNVERTPHLDVDLVRVVWTDGTDFSYPADLLKRVGP